MAIETSPAVTVSFDARVPSRSMQCRVYRASKPFCLILSLATWKRSRRICDAHTPCASRTPGHILPGHRDHGNNACRPPWATCLDISESRYAQAGFACVVSWFATSPIVEWHQIHDMIRTLKFCVGISFTFEDGQIYRCDLNCEHRVQNPYFHRTRSVMSRTIA